MPDMLLEWCSVCKVPSNTMETSKNDAKDSEDDQSRVLVTFCSWGIEGGDM